MRLPQKIYFPQPQSESFGAETGFAITETSGVGSTVKGCNSVSANGECNNGIADASDLTNRTSGERNTALLSFRTG